MPAYPPGPVLLLRTGAQVLQKGVEGGPAVVGPIPVEDAGPRCTQTLRVQSTIKGFMVLICSTASLLPRLEAWESLERDVGSLLEGFQVPLGLT